MIFGIGVDVCSVERLKQSLEATPKLGQRLFTEAELKTKPESLAARFAAKEALAKALGDPRILSWQEVEVLNSELGKPALKLTGASAESVAELGVKTTHLSLTHDAGLAIAMVVLEGGSDA